MRLVAASFALSILTLLPALVPTGAIALTLDTFQTEQFLFEADDGSPASSMGTVSGVGILGERTTRFSAGSPTPSANTVTIGNGLSEMDIVRANGLTLWFTWDIPGGADLTGGEELTFEVIANSLSNNTGNQSTFMGGWFFSAIDSSGGAAQIGGSVAGLPTFFPTQLGENSIPLSSLLADPFGDIDLSDVAEIELAFGNFTQASTFFPNEQPYWFGEFDLGTVAIVPEPSTALLFGFGLIQLSIARHRSRQRA